MQEYIGKTFRNKAALGRSGGGGGGDVAGACARAGAADAAAWSVDFGPPI
jgi:hypothetical protein